MSRSGPTTRYTHCDEHIPAHRRDGQADAADLRACFLRSARWRCGKYERSPSQGAGGPMRRSAIWFRIDAYFERRPANCCQWASPSPIRYPTALKRSIATMYSLRSMMGAGADSSSIELITSAAASMTAPMPWFLRTCSRGEPHLNQLSECSRCLLQRVRALRTLHRSARFFSRPPAATRGSGLRGQYGSAL